MLGASRWLLRKLQRYTVTIHEQDKNRLVKAGDIRELANLAGIYEQVSDGLYDEKLGLLVDGISLSTDFLTSM